MGAASEREGRGLLRVGVDIGGTFTDAVLVTRDDRVVTAKTPTTDDLITGVLNGIESVCESAGVRPADLDTFGHGSTIAVNALIEETGAKTALLTTEGFRDVLEIGEMFRDGDLLYNPGGTHDLPPVPRRRRFEIPERIDADGEVVSPIDEAALGDLVDRLADADVESVAVCLLHSYVNPDHERQVAAHVEERLPNVQVSTSADVSPEIREYHRTSTTVADAYVKPRVVSYVEELLDELDDRGVTATTEIMKSDAGVARADVATERPSSQLLSGPVAGVGAARFVGDRIGRRSLVTFDMGGTSCDVAVVEDGDPVETSHWKIRGMKVNGPFVNITTVGAGGGSVARVTGADGLRVGPESAGSEPGPVCYGRGGTDPTVTDADLLLGVLNPDRFGGTDTTLDVDGARDALHDRVADPLGMDVAEAARAVKRVTDAKLASAIRVTVVKHGYDPRDFALMGFGGAGPMHACDVARELDVDEVVFPNNPGLLSALGVLVADVRHESVRSLVRTVDEVSLARVSDVVRSAVDSHDDRLASEGIARADREFAVSFDMRYAGQAHTLNVPLGSPVDPGDAVTEEAFRGAVEEFHARHGRRYGFTDDDNPVELVNVRVTALGRTPDVALEAAGAGETPVSDARLGTREVLTADGPVDAPFYAWERVEPGHEIDGPAVIEMSNSTVWLPPDYAADVDEYGNVVATRGRARTREVRE